MNVLLDTCVSGSAVKELTDAGYDVVWVGDWAEDPGDDEILARAFRENRILVTLDKDFGELAIVRKIPHAGIIRLVNLSVRQQAPVCLRILQQYGELLQAGAIVTAEPDRLRVRPPESSPGQ